MLDKKRSRRYYKAMINTSDILMNMIMTTIMVMITVMITAMSMDTVMSTIMDMITVIVTSMNMRVTSMRSTIMVILIMDMKITSITMIIVTMSISMKPQRENRLLLMNLFTSINMIPRIKSKCIQAKINATIMTMLMKKILLLPLKIK